MSKWVLSTERRNVCYRSPNGTIWSSRTEAKSQSTVKSIIITKGEIYDHNIRALRRKTSHSNTKNALFADFQKMN